MGLRTVEDALSEKLAHQNWANASCPSMGASRSLAATLRPPTVVRQRLDAARVDLFDSPLAVLRKRRPLGGFEIAGKLPDAPGVQSERSQA